MSTALPNKTDSNPAEELTARLKSEMSFLWGGTNPADNPEYLRGMVELAAELIGFADGEGDDLREALTARVCSGS
ncbi:MULTISPECIES: hypothetical protein [unclassified Leucobacter]|uniref:hypothetical protein n=1 Tax=unclassified Leucobacter TaxID=2621730 RepID=UPI00165E7335|nr:MULTISPECIES: hypothetical protein [unclassified Leucobacter]MBC9927849.1 hypothetical protein [Leucobacter sp. cx-169]